MSRQTWAAACSRHSRISQSVPFFGAPGRRPYSGDAMRTASLSAQSLLSGFDRLVVDSGTDAHGRISLVR